MKPQKDADSRKNNRLYYTLSDGDFPLRLMSPGIHSLISLYLHSDPANLCRLYPSRKVTNVSITVNFLNARFYIEIYLEMATIRLHFIF